MKTTNLLVLVSERLGWDILVGHPGKVVGSGLLKNRISCLPSLPARKYIH